MNPITCGMAADLLPLYLDGCCSADSRAALEAHMDACPACRAQYAQLRRDLTPAAAAAEDPGTDGIARALARKMRRRKRCLRALCAVLGVLLAVLLAYALAALIPCAFPPQLSAAEVADTAWMETEASDLNANRGMLITTGQEAMETRLALIASAQSSIDLGSYIYAPDESGRKITAEVVSLPLYKKSK